MPRATFNYASMPSARGAKNDLCNKSTVYNGTHMLQSSALFAAKQSFAKMNSQAEFGNVDDESLFQMVNITRHIFVEL